MNKYTKMAFAINEIKIGHIKSGGKLDSFLKFITPVGKFLKNKSLDAGRALKNRETYSRAAGDILNPGTTNIGRYVGAKGKAYGSSVGNVASQVQAFFGKAIGKGSGTRRAAEKMREKAKTTSGFGRIAAEGKAEAEYAKAMAMGNQQKYKDLPNAIEEARFGKNFDSNGLPIKFDATTGKRLAAAGSPEANLNAARDALGPIQRFGVGTARMVKDMLVPASVGGIPMAALTYSGLAGLGNREDALAEGRLLGLEEGAQGMAGQFAGQLNQLGDLGFGDRLSAAYKYVKSPEQLKAYAEALQRPSYYN